MKTTFSTIRYFDPMGDGKSERKVLKREFYHSNKSKADIQTYFDSLNKSTGYYSAISIVFKPYLKTKLFTF